MANKNISKVFLLRVPLENDYKHTLYFTDKSSQQSYFQSKKVKEYTDFSYQRKERTIKVPECYDDIYNCNYVMYQNPAYSNKWFYCFIKEMKFISDSVTELVIETDVIQTWLFDYTIKPSFVEREHVNNDAIGKHTVPENLELGDYVVEEVFNPDFGDSHLVISATYDVFEEKRQGSFIQGIYSGVCYYLLGPNEGIAAISYLLNMFESASKSDAITGMFLVPDKLTNYNNIEWDFMSIAGGLSYYKYKKLDNNILGNGASDFGDVMIQKPYSNVNGYTPRNNKLYSYPFKYLMASNNVGGNAIYKYEYFSANPFGFKTKGVLTPGCSIRSYPRLYKGADSNYDEGLSFGKFPICSYNTDMYTNWLTQNGVNIALNVASGVGQIVGGVAIAAGSGGLATAIGGGSVVGGVSTIAQTLAQVYQQSLVPPQAEGNLNCGDVNYSMGINKLIFYKMSIKSEFAQIIDKYFDMFGYKVNLVKTPNKVHRSRYWYTKTIDINIDGNIPGNDIQKIKDCYDNGITFWRNGDEIQNYSLSNNIV